MRLDSNHSFQSKIPACSIDEQAAEGLDSPAKYFYTAKIPRYAARREILLVSHDYRYASLGRQHDHSHIEVTEELAEPVTKENA